MKGFFYKLVQRQFQPAPNQFFSPHLEPGVVHDLVRRQPSARVGPNHVLDEDHGFLGHVVPVRRVEREISWAIHEIGFTVHKFRELRRKVQNLFVKLPLSLRIKSFNVRHELLSRVLVKHAEVDERRNSR